MIFRKIDGSNDWKFGHGTADIALDEEAIELNIKTRILSWVGNCFFAMEQGVDWKNDLDIGRKEALVADVKNVILQSYGVIGVQSVDADLDNSTRNILVRYTITTIFSPVFTGTVNMILGG